MIMKNIKKVIVLGMTAISLSSVFVPLNNVQAAETTSSASSIEIYENSFDSATPSKEQLKSLGISAEDINTYLKSGKTGIILENGVAYDKEGNVLGSKERGKLSWAVKAIRKIYSKLPANVKSLIAKYAGLETILSLVDHFTGAVEDGLYWACKQVGMPDWAAWVVTKAVTLLI